jgi:Cu(I)/Ag(I) efflux system membrane fusion protein
VILCLFTSSCSESESKAVEAEQDQPIAISKNSGAFTKSYDLLLSSYYSLKDALVASDSAKANLAATQLLVNADSLKVKEIHGDSTGVIKETANSFTSTIHSSAEALQKETTLEEKRKEFEVISDALWSLTRTVKYDGAVVYYNHCPMAFENKGAYWLSNSSKIENPYFGDKMLTCGSVEDSVNYSRQ